MSTMLEPGPLLKEVFRAQRADEEATSYPRLEAYCIALAASCEALDAPIVWPVGAAAERLAGAAVLSSRGRIRLRGWSDRLDGERVLLLTVAAVTPIALITAAEHAKALGAFDVHACGVDVHGVDQPDLHEWVDGYVSLDEAARKLEPLAVA
jgi:hypothetical protein